MDKFKMHNHYDTQVSLELGKDGEALLTVESFWMDSQLPDATMSVTLTREQIAGMAQWLASARGDIGCADK